MVAIVAFVDAQMWGAMVALGDTSGGFGFFARSINNFLCITYPAARRIVSPRTKSIVFRHNVYYIMLAKVEVADRGAGGVSISELLFSYSLQRIRC